MKNKNKNDSDISEIRNFVAKYMHDTGCSTKIVEDKKAKIKRGEGKAKFNIASLRKQH